MQTGECSLPNLSIAVLSCSDRMRMRMWCRNYSLMLLRVPDEWSRWVERRAGGDKKGRGKRWWWLSEEWLRGSKSSFCYLCLPGGLPLYPSPSFPPFTLFFPLLPSLAPLPSSTCISFLFNTFYLLVNNFHALFVAFDFGSPFPTTPSSLYHSF